MEDRRISEEDAYGKHIPLRCKNHPDLRWSTKNIEYVGARTLFFDLWSEMPDGTKECDCPIGDLEPVPVAERSEKEKRS